MSRRRGCLDGPACCPRRMNTQSHAVLTLAIVRGTMPGAVAAVRRAHAWVVAGALLPDLPMVFFFFWYQAVRPTASQVLWGETYFRSDWQAVFDTFNSIPILGAGLALCLWRRRREGRLFFSAALIHVVEDFFVHHDDGHAHFFPLSHWVFRSPVSYWDPAHYGVIFAVGEVLAVLAVSVYLYPRLGARWSRALLVGANLLNFGNHVLWQALTVS